VSAESVASGDLRALPPQDLDAERAVLGAMILSQDAIAIAVEVLRPGDFYRPAHQALYECILDLYGRGEPVDAITLGDELTRVGTLARVGGLPYLHTLIATVPTVGNVAYYAQIVAEKAILRRIVEAGVRAIQYAQTGEGETQEIVDRVQAEMHAATETIARQDYVFVGDLADDMLCEFNDRLDRQDPPGLPTGLYDLDDVTGGLRGGQMIVVAARPGGGKSTLGLDFARSCSIKHGMTSAIFSLEMSRSEIMERLFSAEAKVPIETLRNGTFDDDAMMRMARAAERINTAPLVIDDSANLTMSEIRAKARRLKQTHDLKLIIVDYLQLMTSGKRVESRQQEVSEISRQAKLLAKELDVPVVAISQLNRAVEDRADKRPMMSDLRESGAIEQDADMIMLLYRGDLYDEHANPGEVELHLAKHRGGPTRTFNIRHQLHYSRFVNATDDA
jgi:replicative DNA helicase